LKRTGIRIQATIEKAISHGIKVKQCLQKGDFVWQSSVIPVRVRDRSGLDSKSKNIEFVAPEEINAAIIEISHALLTILVQTCLQHLAMMKPTLISLQVLLIIFVL